MSADLAIVLLLVYVFIMFYLYGLKHDLWELPDTPFGVLASVLLIGSVAAILFFLIALVRKEVIS
jgi:hypothetical protein